MLKLLLVSLPCILPATVCAGWEDSFERFDQEKWTTQPSGLRLSEEPLPAGVLVKEGVLALDEPLRGVRLTSRRRFLYGTLETRVKIRPRGYQYVGYMSRAPWGANTLMCMSLPESNGWRLVSARDGRGGDTGVSTALPENEWCDLKILWEASRAALYVNGVLRGEVSEASRIPQTPIPIILDALANNPMEVDWIRVTGDVPSGDTGTLAPPPALPRKGPTITLKSKDWRVLVDASTGIIRECHHLRPRPLAWTPPTTAGMDFYVRRFPDGRPVRFRRSTNEQRIARGSDAPAFRCRMRPEEGPYCDALSADLDLRLEGQQLRIAVRATGLREIDHPVEIGLGLPFQPEVWRRQVFPRLPWLALSPRQEGQVRLPFLADPEDATVPSATGNWVFYPIGLLEGTDRTILWGGMDLGKRVVLSPNNHGCVPSITSAPRRWPKGKTLELALTLQGFVEPGNGLPQVLRWFLSHCHSTDPLTSDLFPVRDWTPRTFPKGGGVGMPDVRITRANASADSKFLDRVERLLVECSVPNLWLGTWHAADGSYPIAGKWHTGTGLPLSAEAWRTEVARLKERGLRPCLYVFQFIVPELCKERGRPDKSWVAYGADGTLSLFDRYTVGEQRGSADWFTKEVAERIGTTTFTLAYGDYGNESFRRWYTDQIKAAIEYYNPSGLSFDYGWAVVGPESVYSPANPRTSQAHGRLRVQADLWRWLRERHPEMQVIVNDCPGSPSQLFANCMLLENSDVMSDLDFLAGKALGSAMSSMDYFADHNRSRWTRLMMLDLARGCSLGSPFWMLTSPPESEYIPTWRKFLDFSGRTTRLPLLAREDAVACVSGRNEIAGSVWSNGHDVMAVAFDRRMEGDVRETALRILVPRTVSREVRWQLTPLTKMNVEAPDSAWKADRGKDGTLRIAGPLAPGEMVLVESKVR